MIGKTYWDDIEMKKIQISSWREAEATFNVLKTFKDITTYSKDAEGFVGFSDEGTEFKN